MNITVTFADATKGGGYSFYQPSGFDEWETVPRVGDHLIDRNEFKYQVKEVIWYNPLHARLTVERVF